MIKIRLTLLAVICLFITSCETEKHKFPTEKRYWDTNDYADVVRELLYGYEQDEKLPTFDDPKTRVIVEKLTDQQNFKVVLDDNELGLKHKNEIAKDFFNRWRDMQDIYQATDRKDNYLYDKEMIEVWQFGLSLQLKYFKLGNDNILISADDPDSYQTKNNVNSNIKTLIKNFLIYLDEINNEKAFSEQGKELFAKGIDNYFTELIEFYPNANYGSMEKKIELMLNKTQTEKIKNSLTKIKELIESKKQQEL